MNYAAIILFVVVLISGCTLVLANEPIQLTPESVVRFATPEEGATLLGSSDDFTTSMSPLDRALRVGKMMLARRICWGMCQRKASSGQMKKSRTFQDLWSR
jgi:hypothetical protein